MPKIGIIGAGVGGLTAGILLTQQGTDVSIFEAKKKGNIAHPWMDDIRFDIFEYCGIEPPSPDCYYNKGKRLFISPDCKNSFHVPFSPPMVEISVERPALAEHMISLAKKVGCELHFGKAVSNLIIEDENVVGFAVDGKERRFDLVIDSSGLHSPFRAQVPVKFGIEAQPDKCGIMFARRAFYKFKKGSEPPETDRNIYIKHMGSHGLSWCNLNQKGEVDVFVGRIGGLGEDEWEKAVTDLHARHEFFSYDLILDGGFAEISLRSPIGRMVADGYAAIGDAAYMTMPMMGSGIEASMKAAYWLAGIIKKYSLTHFSARNLWEYQLKYYKELGSRYAFVDKVKDLLLGIDTDDLNWLFGCGAVTDEDMGLVSTDNSGGPKISPVDIIKKAGILFSRPEVIAHCGAKMGRAAMLKAAAGAIPEEYNEVKIASWQRRYEKLLKK